MSDRAGASWLALASRSPRRVQLLREAGFDPVPLELDVDDSELRPGRVSPEHAAMALAYFKAAAGARRPEGQGRVILGADTFVVKNGAIIGKPRDANDADRIIRMLSGGSHVVLTGVAIVNRRFRDDDANRWLFVDTARVSVGDITDASRRAYIDSGDWSGKAGAYNLAERLDAGWPISFEGDPGAIMGLPMRRLSPMLRALAATAAREADV